MDSITVPGPFCSTPECAEALANLTAAANTRDVIGMAKGLLMARSRVSPEEAFDLLRRASQRENIKVRDIARYLVETRGRPGLDEWAPTARFGHPGGALA